MNAIDTNIPAPSCESLRKIIDDHTTCVVALIDKTGIVMRSNSSLDRLLKASPISKPLVDFMVASSRSLLNDMIAKTISGQESAREILHFDVDNSLPASYLCLVVPSGEELCLFGELASALDQEQAVEYALVNNQLAVMTRQLQKSNHDLKVMGKTLNLTNESLRAEMAERERIKTELEKARDKELEIGADIQKTLLTEQPPRDIQGVEIAAITIPSQKIDGDFYTFFKYSDTCLDVVVGDVMGKGVPAALVAAACASMIPRAINQLIFASDTCIPPDPSAIVQTVHNGLTEELIGLSKFVTLIYARFDLARRLLTFVDCGHTKTVHYIKQSDVCKLIEGENTPLGVNEEEVYKQTTIPFGEEDVFFFYSDGLLDAMNEEREIFGEERILQTIAKSADLSVPEIMQSVKLNLDAYAGARRNPDDLTYLTVKILPS